jgi:membrane protease YdiL (CAAX protease family)
MEVNEEQLPLQNQPSITTFKDYIPQQQPPAPMSYGVQFILLMSLIIGGLILAAIASAIIIFTMMGGSFSSLSVTEIMKPEHANANKVLQIASTLALFFAPAFVFALIVHRKPLQYLGFNSKISPKQIGLVILVACTGLFLSGALGEINELIPISKGMRTYFKKLEDDYLQQMMAMIQMKNIVDYLVSLIVIALAPAIFEEVLFRGALQNLFTNWFKKPWVAILITSVIFSAIHMSYFGFLPRAMLGVVLGLLFYYSKNIWTNILAHFLNNGIAVTQIYILSQKGKIDKKALDALNNTQFPVGIVILLAATTIFGMVIWLYLFKKESDKVLIKNQITNTENTLA